MIDHDRTDIALHPVGRVHSPIRARHDAFRQPDEGAPPATISIDPSFADCLSGIAAGDRLIVVSWLHLADRDARRVHPRSDPARRPAGVFSTRAPDRPNPIGLHEVTVVDVAGTDISVDALEAVDGTPVLDLKPNLGPAETR